jgi:hypothetical protein
MPVMRRRQPRAGPQFIQERHVEGRATHPRYYALTEAPNAGEFGQAEYVDEEGRQYRVALGTRTDYPPGKAIPPRAYAQEATRNAQGHAKLWVKLPKGAAGSWFAQVPGRMPIVRLTPVKPGLPALTVRVAAAFRVRPTLRTGVVYLQDFDEAGTA